MSAKKKEDTTASPTIITLTLPTPEGGGISDERATATILIQRGDLAHIRQFRFTGFLDDITEAIRDAGEALGLLEDDPPTVPELPAEAPKQAKSAPKPPPADAEPTIDVPLKKGKKTVKLSHIKIVRGETDSAAYQQALAIAGKLIDGRLWDGDSPIRFEDVYAVAKRMKYLTPKDLSLFELSDFVQCGESQPS